MKSLVFATVLIAALAADSFGQRNRDYQRTHSEGFYINVGVANGPEFTEFFNFVNEYYQVSEEQKLDRFDNGFDIGLGYLVRLYPNFALDVGFSIYRLKSSGRFDNNNPAVAALYVDHDLDYQVGLFSASIPVLLDFDRRQPIVPYVGIGISIFSMRLDDIRDDGLNAEILRDTNTSVGGHFETGLFAKINRKIWIDFKARWHSGSSRLRVLEPPPPAALGKFKIEQDLSQFTLGAIYFFR